MGYFNIVATALLLACVHVEGVPSDCGLTYQRLLQDLVTLKGSCDGAGFRDCCQVKDLVPQAGSGSYGIVNPCSVRQGFSSSSSKQYAHCDMDTDGGKWLVIQRRINGSVDFYRNWTDYVYGFGDLDGEFWYGLENIHCLTTRDAVELRIEIGNGTMPSIVWTYQLFQVGGAETNYRLTIGQSQGVGNGGDSMAYHNNRPFSTRDQDNDSGARNCATVYGGAWWYGYCFNSNLNGKYELHTPEDGGTYSEGANRLCWRNDGQYSHYTKIQMKVRPKVCTATSCD